MEISREREVLILPPVLFSCFCLLFCSFAFPLLFIASLGEEQCTDMINMACESVQPDTESEEFCDEFFFFTGDLDEEERKRRKRLGLYVRRN